MSCLQRPQSSPPNAVRCRRCWIPISSAIGKRAHNEIVGSAIGEQRSIKRRYEIVICWSYLQRRYCRVMESIALHLRIYCPCSGWQMPGVSPAIRLRQIGHWLNSKTFIAALARRSRRHSTLLSLQPGYELRYGLRPASTSSKDRKAHSLRIDCSL